MDGWMQQRADVRANTAEEGGTAGSCPDRVVSLYHTHTETHTPTEAPLVRLTIPPPPTISACKDFFIGICHALSFPRKTAVPSYEVIALISAWLRA